jgi:hypothetical protein
VVACNTSVIAYCNVVVTGSIVERTFAGATPVGRQSLHVGGGERERMVAVPDALYNNAKFLPCASPLPSQTLATTAASRSCRSMAGRTL